MPRVLTQDLVPGMVTAEDIYTFSNQLILPVDFELTDKSITMLEFYSILSVRVKDDSASIAEAEHITHADSIYSEKVRATQAFKEFKATFENSVGTVKNALNDLVERNAPLNTDVLMSEASRLVAGSTSGIHIFDMLHNLRQFDDPTYAHCINVSLICHVFGMWLGFPEEDLEILTMAGMLHDVGKLKIPENIITKPDKLNDAEYAKIKTHTIEGYNILKNLPIDDRIKKAALMHHEKCDGTGYPLGLVGERIDDFAKIVAIADVYDAMTSARVYRGPLCPFKVISIFESEGYQKYDSKYILTFLEYIVNTYLNNRVRLSNGLEGDIVLINKLDLAHPMVHCGDQFIDLSHEHGISIEAIL